MTGMTRVPPSAYEIIRHKRDGGEHDSGHIGALVAGAADGSIPDSQLAAWLMAVCCRGMTRAETRLLTEAMLRSGETWSWAPDFPHWVDKHSTGGVGDGVSLLLTPWVAAAGVPVGMLSGRSLGHTGGTLDKLESAPGFDATMGRDRFAALLAENGCAVAAASDTIVPADRRLYALRDITATVESLPLITASIMSKKLAAAPRSLVLDVKAGGGAFMRKTEHATALADSLLAAAADFGVPAVALITAMDVPLGGCAGNLCELEQAIASLAGDGPADLVEVTLALGAEMLLLAGVEKDVAAARARLERVRASGEASARLRRWLESQGARWDGLQSRLRHAATLSRFGVPAPRAGTILSMDTRGLGHLAGGLGRPELTAPLDFYAGVRFLRKTGDEVSAGEPLLEVLEGETARDRERVTAAALACYEIGEIGVTGSERVARLPLVVERRTPAPAAERE